MRGSRSAHSPSDRSVGYERRSAMPHLPVHYPPTLRPFQTPFSEIVGADGERMFLRLSRQALRLSGSYEPGRFLPFEGGTHDGKETHAQHATRAGALVP